MAQGKGRKCKSHFLRSDSSAVNPTHFLIYYGNEEERRGIQMIGNDLTEKMKRWLLFFLCRGIRKELPFWLIRRVLENNPYVSWMFNELAMSVASFRVLSLSGSGSTTEHSSKLYVLFALEITSPQSIQSHATCDNVTIIIVAHCEASKWNE